MCPDKVCVHHDGFTQCLWSTLIDSRALRGRGMIHSIMRDYYGRVRPRLILLEIDDEMAYLGPSCLLPIFATTAPCDDGERWRSTR